MSFTARLFVSLVTAAGSGAAMLAISSWKSTDTVTFGICFALCCATSLLRVALPRIQGSFSPSYVVLVWGIAHLGFGETILMGTASAVVQSYWRCIRNPQPIQLAFNVALIWLSVGVSTAVFSADVIQSLIVSPVARIVLASGAYFLV